MKKTGNKLFFIKEKNLQKIRYSADDKIIFTEDTSDEKPNSLSAQLKILAEESNQIVNGYNPFWIQKWGFKKLGNNKSFAQELIFDNSSLWYFVEFIMHRLDFTGITDESLHTVDIPLSDILIFIDFVQRIISKQKPGLVVIENRDAYFNKIVYKVCRKERIKIRILNYKEKKIKLKRVFLETFFVIRTYLRTRVLIRKIISKLFCEKKKNKKVLILTNSGLTNKNNSTDFFWGPIVKELEKKGVSYKVCEYDQFFIVDNIKKIFKRYVPQKYDTQFIGTFYDYKTAKMTRRIVRFMRGKFKELDKRKDFRESLNYKGINFYDCIRKRLQKIFLAYSPYIADVYALGKSVVKKENPKVVIIDHEENFFGKSFLFEANKQNTYSIALENEILYTRRTKFIHTPIPIILNKKSPLWRPIADKKLVQGEYSRDWFYKKDYIPLKNIGIVGSPKYDFLNKYSANDKKIIAKKYGIKPSEKLIVVITSMVSWENDYIKSIMKAIKGFKNFKVIVKQHPGDDASNQKIIRKILRDHNIKGHVIKDEDTGLLLSAADFIFSYNSTVINEVILLNKNILVYEPRDDFGWAWIEDGVVKQCKTFPNYEKEIKLMLKRNLPPDKEARRKYIKKYLYSDDGKSSERTVNEIRKQIG